MARTRLVLALRNELKLCTWQLVIVGTLLNDFAPARYERQKASNAGASGADPG